MNRACFIKFRLFPNSVHFSEFLQFTRGRRLNFFSSFSIFQGSVLGNYVKDIVILWKGWILALLILLLHTCLTLFLPIPDCPTYVNNLTPLIIIWLA